MLQISRHLTDSVNGILAGKRYLILVRDTKYCHAFREFLQRERIKVIRLPPRSPNLNATLKGGFASRPPLLPLSGRGFERTRSPTPA
jgi:hypothetical protein